MAKEHARDKLKSGLNARMIILHFFVFLSLDIALVILAAAGGFLFAEQTVSDIANQLNTAPPGNILAESVSERRAISLGDIDISYQKTVPQGLPLSGVRNIFPENTRTAERTFRYDADAKNDAERLRSVSYEVSIPSAAKRVDTRAVPEGYTVIVVRVGRYLAIAKIALHIILILQLLSLIHTGVKSGRAIKRTLR
ncbi:MAG: hypothetical protein LBL63_04795, partial [Clostridiales Family XIII bacterium]|nr:hypothetical protein [Clostridiales Family XIII bacterium]